MALETLKDYDIRFDPDFISAAELTPLVEEFRTESLAKMLEGVEAPVAPEPVAGAAERSFDDVMAELRRQVDAGEFASEALTEVRQELGPSYDLDKMFAEVERDMRPVIEKGEISPAVLATLDDNMGYARAIERDGRIELEIGGKVAISASTEGVLGANWKLICAIAVVVIDVVFVGLALISIATHRSAKFAKQVEKIVEKVGARYLKLAKMLLGRLADMMRKVRDAKTPAQKADAVRGGITDMAKSIFAAFKYFYDHLWSSLKDILWAYLDDWWAMGKAILSFGAMILAAIGTAGASLAAAVLNLVSAIVQLVEDCIALSKVDQKAVASAA